MLDSLRASIRRVAFALLGLLAVLFLYLSYIQVIEGDYLAGHPLNRRTAAAAEKVERGTIFDRRGEKLAYSEKDGQGRYVRRYPYGAVAAHVVGYSSPRYGQSGAESAFNGELSGMANPERRFGPITGLWTAKAGNNVTLTIDGRLQETAYKALGNRRGAVVAIAPRSGAVLVMVSRPAFDPEALDDDWKEIVGAAGSPLLNRAAQGLYPPGSTIKVLVADAALTEKITDKRKTYDCQGSLKIGPDYVLHEANDVAHGKVDLEEALAVSCNVTFGRLSLELGRNGMAKAFDRFAFSRPLGGDIAEVSSRLPDFGRLGDGDLAQTGIGQGSLLVTPLRMAMLAATFANRGTLLKPFLVSRVTAPDGAVLRQFGSTEFAAPTSPATAAEVSRMMQQVVSGGTGYAARVAGVKVAGKTGTAENPHGASHAWFIGFAPADAPEIAIAVVVENGGSGGEAAAPIARQVIARALR
ncbi:peptidoglycan D,D-transpeptidase FtsI family protein [Anaeroselena agilis]|uniref:Penicillin-binding transpeptidase domain-containing protein n=1 Tax=Anaeroselena agilis TaxID=3063788 RepID=A0ABU3NXF6_9FIRM|nr:penicillin-binding transpeptidase domain-containing protein [Selenomonadales bacterium 4137-cl]